MTTDLADSRAQRAKRRSGYAFRPPASLTLAGLLIALLGVALVALTVGAAGIPLARLPAAARNDFGSPEQLVAMLTASAIPLEGARVAAQFDDTPEAARLVLELTGADGRMRERVISAHSTPDGWRLTVPDGEIQRYFVALQKPAAP